MVAFKDIQFACSHKGTEKRQLHQKDEQDKQKKKSLQKITQFYASLVLLIVFTWEFI